MAPLFTLRRRFRYKIHRPPDISSSDHTNQAYNHNTKLSQIFQTDLQSTPYIMQLSSVLVAVFAATVLAKNDPTPWVSSYSNADCTGEGAGDSVNFYENCAQFNPVYPNVIFNFGSQGFEIDSIAVYSDANCQHYAGKRITSTLASGTPAQCINMTTHGGPWKSVKWD